MKSVKIATMINTVDPIFLERKHRLNVFIVVLENTPLSDFAVKNFLPENLIFIKLKKGVYHEVLYFEDILSKTDISKKLSEKGIKYFIIPHQNSQKISKWAEKNKIKIIGTPLKYQKTLENKIYFDNKLKENGIDSPPTVDLEIANHIVGKKDIFVGQADESYGMFGTNFLRGRDELNLFLKNNKKKIKHLLVRKYLPGPSFGVTILINKKGGFSLSAFRRQCFKYNNGLPKDFIGIQWMPIDFFNKQQLVNINLILKKLASYFGKIGFFGIANIDFILSGNKAYVLECNPRLSSATQHIFSVKGITNLKDPWQFYLDIFTKNNLLLVKNATIPKSKFCGSLLDVDIKEKIKIKKIWPIGVYALHSGKVKYISDNVETLKQQKNYFFLYHEIPAKNISCSDFTFCTAISNFMLFNLKTGEINQRGKIIYNHFKKYQ